MASGGEDGTIAIRDARLPDNKAKFEMTIDANPVLALSFTPDGAFIAGATRDRVLIWKVGEYTMPRAQWSRTSQPGRLSPKMNGTAEIEDQHCLCWDATGQRLAFGVNDLVGLTPVSFFPSETRLTWQACCDKFPVMIRAHSLTLGTVLIWTRGHQVNELKYRHVRVAITESAVGIFK